MKVGVITSPLTAPFVVYKKKKGKDKGEYLSLIHI